MPLGKARMHREGSDISLITWGAMVYTAEEAAQQLDDDGVSVEIIDLRTVMPWDKEGGSRVGAKNLEGAGAARRHANRRLRGRDRSDRCGGGIRGSRRARPSDRCARHAGAVLAASRKSLHPAGRRRHERLARARGVLRRSDGHHRDSRRRHATDGRVRFRGHDHQVAQAGRRAGQGRRRAARDLDRQGRHGGAEPGLRDPDADPRAGRRHRRRRNEAGGDRRRGRRGDSMDDVPEPATAQAAAESAAVSDAPETPTTETVEEATPAPPAASETTEPSSTNGKTFVSPVVAKIASEHGVDPSQVQGTGRGGRVTKKDILNFIESGGKAAPPAAAPAQPQAPSAPPPAAKEAPARRGRSRAVAARRELRADDGDAQGNRRAHATLARHIRTRHERDRGRHVESQCDPRETEKGVPAELRRQPDLPHLRRARRSRDAARVPVDQRRDPR